jgi:uncharacterized protein
VGAGVNARILIQSGEYFHLLYPHLSLYTIEDIAHGLSHICRFTGQVRSFYSVAQHSVLVSRLVPEHLALQGLMHDASEAFLGDVASPLKQLLPEYKDIERRVEDDIADRFGLPRGMDPEVKRADLIALATEKRDLMPSTGDWPVPPGYHGVSPDTMPITPWTATFSRFMFLRRYSELTS